MKSIYPLLYCLCFTWWLSCSIAFGKEQQKIAILELQNKAPSQIKRGEISHLTDEIRRIIGYLPQDQFLIMTKENMEQTLPPGRTLEDCEGTCEVKTGQLLQANWIITGSLSRFGRNLKANLKLHNTETSVFTIGQKASGKSLEELEKNLKFSTLNIALEIAPDFKKNLIRKAGNDAAQQLNCLMNPKQCEDQVLASGDADYDAAMAKLEQRERKKRDHRQQIEREWKYIDRINTKQPQRLIKALRQFIQKYETHEFGNHYHYEASALLSDIEGEYKEQLREKHMKSHQKRVTRDWKRIRRIVKTGNNKGKRALEKFLEKYADHELGNPLAQEAKDLFKDAREKYMAKQQSSHDRKVRKEWQSLQKRLKSGNRRKIDRAIKALIKFVKKYKDHELGNPVEDEAVSSLERLEEMGWVSGIQNLRRKRVSQMVSIPGGSFTMGSVEDRPMRRVKVKSFSISSLEITVEAYRKCVDAGECSTKGLNKYHTCTWTLPDNADLPITCVSWIQAREYARWAGGDLPSEAQWAYAARGGKGSEFLYAGSDQLDEVGWYYNNSRGKVHRVAQKRPNGYGLYDMSGNAAEWVLDEYKAYSSMKTSDTPVCSSQGCEGKAQRVHRGGSWSHRDKNATVTKRDGGAPSYRFHYLGFRIVKNDP